MSFSFFTKGSWASTTSWLERLSQLRLDAVLAKSGQKGVDALASATPVDTGLAARSWSYSVEHGAGYFAIYWFTTDIEEGFPVAIRLRYGYATGTGGYVAGRNYISPAIQPIFDQIEADIRRAVTSR